MGRPVLPPSVGGPVLRFFPYFARRVPLLLPRPTPSDGGIRTAAFLLAAECRPLTRHRCALPQPSHPRRERHLHLHGYELGARPGGRRLRLQPGTDRNGIRPCDDEPGLVL